MTRPPRYEISDLIIRHDPRSHTRMPVERSQVVDRLLASGQSRAAAIVARMPAIDGVLERSHVDGVLIRAHTELQRLSEEFLQPRRVLALLRPMVEVLRRHRPGTRIRVVDLGTGLGYLPRWLAAKGDLGDDVELIGVDFNHALITAAREAAHAEALECRFVVGDALQLDVPAAIVTSVGVLHHFARDSLEQLFFDHERAGVAAFMHYDIAPTWIAPFGAWLFHTARMREPVARHDGVLSALRSHDDETLVAAARARTTSYRIGIFGPPHRLLPINRVIRPVIGIAPDLSSDLRSQLGGRARHLSMWS